jgi:hypothetical protein
VAVLFTAPVTDDQHDRNPTRRVAKASRLARPLTTLSGPLRLLDEFGEDDYHPAEQLLPTETVLCWHHAHNADPGAFELLAI